MLDESQAKNGGDCVDGSLADLIKDIDNTPLAPSTLTMQKSLSKPQPDNLAASKPTQRKKAA